MGPGELGDVSPAALAAAGVEPIVGDLVNVYLALMHRMREHLERVSAAHGLNPPTTLALRMLEQPLSQRDIAERIGCDPSYVTGIVDSLERVGAAERRTDPDDRRVKRVVLTDEGRSLRDRIGVALMQGAPIAEGLDGPARRRLHDLLVRALGASGGATS